MLLPKTTMVPAMRWGGIAAVLTVLLAFPAWGQSTLRSRPARPISVVDGIDWSLPSRARMSPSAGYLTWNPNWALAFADRPQYRDGGIHLASFLLPTWAELNPAEGEYDWRRLDQQIRFSTGKPGMGYVLCPVGFSETHPNFFRNRPQRRVTPVWVERKGEVTYLSNGAVAAWEPGSVHQRYFGQFLKALGARYKNDPKLIGVSMAGLDCFHGEWCWRGYDAGWVVADVDRVLREAEEQTGLTPATFEAWGKRFIDDYVAAFRPNQSKLVWMNSEDQCIWTPRRPKAYIAPATALWKYAYAKGCGNRDGGVEIWNRYLNEGHGMRWTDAGYLEVIEDLAPLRENRFWYTENEYYRRDWPKDDMRVRWFTSSMRTLQMRRQWMAVWSDLDMLDALIPGFVRWMELSLGKTARTSVDAWCWLREGYPKRRRPLKNYERWLFQRDVEPDGLTQPAERVDVSSIARGGNRYVFAEDYEYHARRTDVRSGSPYIYFSVDRTFAAGDTREWLFKVTYLDSPDVTWTVEYATAMRGTTVGIMRTEGTGQMRTATFTLPGVQFRRATRGMDFRIACRGDEDLTVQFVRLVKNR